MGLKNYNEQINLIRQADSQIAYLNSYANSMNALIISLGSLWDDNVDQGYMLNAIGNCVRIASEIAYDYSVFSANSIKWLNNMDNLEKLVRALIPGKDIKVKPFRSDYDTPTVSQRDKIRVNPDDLSDFATQIDGYTKRLEAIHVKTSGLNKQIDNLIISKFASRYSLSSINKRIVKLKNINSNIANALRKISEAYRKTENELKGMVDVLEFGADSAGNVNSQVEKTTVISEDHSSSGVEEKARADAIIDVTKNPSATEKEAVNISSEFFEPQIAKGDCNVTSQAMLLKRLMYIKGDDNYANVNRNTVRGSVTGSSSSESKDVLAGYNYGEYHVSCYAKDDAFINKYENNPSYHYGTGFVNLESNQKKERLKLLLDEHPEGIVIWGKYATKYGGAHAVLLTSYDEDGQFYCADPANPNISGEIPLTQSVDAKDGESDTDILNRITQYYVAD